MYRRGGIAGSQGVLPEQWIADGWRPRATSPWSGNGYGYGWFAKTSDGHPVHFAWGYGRQMLSIIPALALTVVMTSDPSPHLRAESHLPALHALLDQGIVPAAIRENATN